MIGLISGKKIFDNPPSPGMAVLDSVLAGLYPHIRRVCVPWQMRPPLSFFDPADEPVLLIGHSFGGFTAFIAAWELNHFRPMQPVHLILLDPVCWDRDLTDGLQESWLAQWIVGHIEPTANVVTCTNLLCGAMDPVRNCHVIGDGRRQITNRTIFGTNHDSVVSHPDTQDTVQNIAIQIFGGN